MLLSEMKIGSYAKIVTIKGEGFLKMRLLEMGLIPNVVIKLQKKAPLGDPIEILVRSYVLTLRKNDLDLIEVIGIVK